MLLLERWKGGTGLGGHALCISGASKQAQRVSLHAFLRAHLQVLIHGYIYIMTASMQHAAVAAEEGVPAGAQG